jgi:hypothetical protein
VRYVKLSGRAVIIVAMATLALAAAATGVAASTASGSGAQSRHGNLFRSALIGRPEAADLNVAIRGVSPGGAPWTIDRGTARVAGNGRVRVSVDGLLITGTGTALDGTTGPVANVVASVTCDGTAPTIVSTGAVPLSPNGDARIDQQVALPTTCLAPIVLVRANSSSGPWIAAAGF